MTALLELMGLIRLVNTTEHRAWSGKLRLYLWPGPSHYAGAIVTFGGDFITVTETNTSMERVLYRLNDRLRERL